MNQILDTLERIFARPDAVIPAELFLLLIVLGVLIVVWDLIDRRRKAITKQAGFSDKAQMVALKGSKELPGRLFRSRALGISSKPDALYRQDGLLIPVDRRPSINKVRDRHIAQMIVHMLLIEEIEQTPLPYGILLLGTPARAVRIKNTPERRRWVETLVDEMNSILDGTPAIPAPVYQKCKHCDVRDVCEHSA